MLASDSVIPRFICRFLMECKSAGHDLQLLAGKGARQQFPVDGDGGLIVSVVYMNVGFVMLAYVAEQHIDHHASKPAQFRHIASRSFIAPDRAFGA